MRDVNDLVRMATGQHGLLTTTQIRASGLGKGAQQGLVRDGFLEPVRRGVLRLAGSPQSWAQGILAVCLTAGSPLVASHRSAMRLWEWRTDFDGLEVSVRYPGNRSLPGVIVHRSVDLRRCDVVVLEGIPVTSPSRTLCDAGLIFPEHEVQRMTDHAVAAGLVTPRGLIDMRRRVGEHGRTGVVKLDAAIDGVPAGASGAESGPEVRLLRLLTDAGLPDPVLQHAVSAGTTTYRLDIAYPHARLGIEYDGVEAHTGPDRFVSDRRRQNAIVGVGWTIMRVTHADLRDRPAQIVRQVRHHLLDL